MLCTKNSLLHDSPNTQIHEDHKASKKKRLKKGFVQDRAYFQIPATERKAGMGFIDPFELPTNGFCFFMTEGRAKKAAKDSDYTDAAIIKNLETKYTRIRLRNGKKVRDYGNLKSNLQSVLVTLPPWSQGCLQTLGASELEFLMLELSQATAKEVTRISGRPAFGGAVHYDGGSGCHLHFHFESIKPKDSEGRPGETWDKNDYQFIGKWSVASFRIENKFPGLLSEGKLEMLRGNLAKREQAKLVDLAAAKAVDKKLEEWIREKGALLRKQYEKDCEEYCKSKRAIDEGEKNRKMVQAALEIWQNTGIWPLSWRFCKKAVLKLLPPEIRQAIIISMRVHQIIRRPVKTLTRMAIQGVCQQTQEREIN